jgi:hypothetical protein
MHASLPDINNKKKSENFVWTEGPHVHQASLMPHDYKTHQ